jgi:hypothetical protein
MTYHQKIMSASPLVRIYLEREAQEVAEHCGQGMLFLDCWCSVRCNEPESAKRAFVQVRRLSFNHLNGHNAERPDVDLAAVFFPGYDLGGHPVWGSDHGSSLVVTFVDLCAESEIGCRSR